MTHNRTLQSFVQHVVFAIIVLFVLSLCFHIYIHISKQEQIFSKYEQIPSQYTVGLILGTTPKTAQGESNTYFTERIAGAVRLYQEGVIRQIIVSGDNRTKYYNEPRAMKHALLLYGIPENAIIEDFAGRDTYDSILRSRDVFGINNPIIITQRYHAERALYIAHWNGIDAIAYVVPGSRNNIVIAKQYVREYFARLKMFSDVMRNRSPSITSIYEPIHTPSK
jgi:SanA protein